MTGNLEMKNVYFDQNISQHIKEREDGQLAFTSQVAKNNSTQLKSKTSQLTQNERICEEIEDQGF